MPSTPSLSAFEARPSSGEIEVRRLQLHLVGPALEGSRVDEHDPRALRANSPAQRARGVLRSP
eukprot:7288769-Pyramimonas_sp.AAC.1